MPCKNLIALPLVCTLALLLMGFVSPHAGSAPPQGPAVPPPAAAPLPGPPKVAPEPLPPPAPVQPQIFTQTIYNGTHVQQQSFIWCDGSWQVYDACAPFDVFARDCPDAPWHRVGTYDSRGRAEDVACALRASGNLAVVRQHCD